MAGTNAVLLKIQGPGPLDNYGNPDPANPTVLWQGQAAGYLKRERRTIVSGGLSVNVKRDVFTALDSAGAPVLEQSGGDWDASTVVIEDRRTQPVQTRRFTVNAFEHRAAGTVADSIRLELDQETA